MKALLLGISKLGKVQVLYAGDKLEARQRYRDYKPRVGITQIELWERASGKTKAKEVEAVTRKKNG